MLTRRYGEDIICPSFGPAVRREAKERAVRLSMGKRHGWARVWYLRGPHLMRHVYSDGKLYQVGEWPGGSPWYSSRLTIRQAIQLLKGYMKQNSAEEDHR